MQHLATANTIAVPQMLSPRRIVWLMVPAGTATELAIEDVWPEFQPGDVIVQIGSTKITDVVTLDEITRTPQRMWSVTIKRAGRLMKLQMSG